MPSPSTSRCSPVGYASNQQVNSDNYNGSQIEDNYSGNNNNNYITNVNYGSISFDYGGSGELKDAPQVSQTSIAEPQFALINKDGTINRRSSIGAINLSISPANGTIDYLDNRRHSSNSSNCCGLQLFNCCNKFRYLICVLVLIGNALNNYTNHTLYIAAIKMVSGDVLESGLTTLRAHHISLDPLASSRNAAAPGTCPIQLEPSQALKSLVSQAISSALNNETENMVNLTQLSLNQWVAMGQDAQSLATYVQNATKAGYLVDWTINDRALIFSAHTIGGIILAVPISQLGLRYGNKLPISFCFIACTLRALLLPTIVSNCNFWVVFTFELLVGAPGQMIAVVVVPLAASWLITSEANVFVGLITLASLFGDTLTNFLSAQLLASGVTWATCFYIPGGVFALLTIIWLWLGADEPEFSSNVTSEELILLEHSVTNLKKQLELEEMRLLNCNQSSRCACQDIHCPARLCKRVANWNQIVTCKTIWALVGVNFAANWNSKATNMWPSYFASILHLSTETIGFLTGFRGFIVVLFGFGISYFTRSFTIHRPFGMSLTAYRKWGQLLALIFLSLSLGAMTLFDCSTIANTTAVMLTPLVSSFNSISAGQMILDLSAEDSGLILGFLRMVGIGDVFVLPVSSFILSYGVDAVAGDRLTWRIFWLTGLGIKVITSLAFLLVAEAQTGRQYSRLVPKGACRALKRRSK